MEKLKKMFEEHNLVKFVSIVLLALVIGSWFIPSGTFSGSEFIEGDYGRIGLVHIFYAFTFAIQNFSIQLGFLAMVGMFYGVVTKTDGYKKLINRLAKFGKGKEIIFALVISLIVAALASLLNNTMILFVFMPFLVTLLRKMGFGKMNAFATTFGSMLVGILGATYGTEGLIGFADYLGYGGSEVTLTTEILIRGGVLLLSYILFNFFNVLSLKNSLENKKKNAEEDNDDAFKLDDVKSKRAKTWPTAVLMIVLFIFAILGFMSWNMTSTGVETFGIEIFDKFHNWLMTDEWFILNINDTEYPIFDILFGASLPNMSYELAPAFGSWYLFTYSTVLAFVTLLIAIFSKMKFSELLTNAWDGLSKFVKPMLFLLFAYVAFVFLYWTPIIPTITYWISKISGGLFNPFVTAIQAFVGGFFNSDFAYLGYTLNGYLGSFAGTEGNLVYLIYSTIYGLVQFVTPLSFYLLFGLAYMDVKYTDWIKYVWKFFVGMLICLLVIFALLTYL